MKNYSKFFSVAIPVGLFATGILNLFFQSMEIDLNGFLGFLMQAFPFTLGPLIGFQAGFMAIRAFEIQNNGLKTKKE